MIADATAELKARKKFVRIEHVPLSQLPYRVVKIRTGVVEGSFSTHGAAENFILALDLVALSKKPTRRR